MKRFLIIVLFSALFSSCFVTKKQRAKICNECKTTDSVYVKDSIYIRDTVVSIKPDSATLDALLECDSFGNVRIAEIESLQGDLVNLEARLKNNRFKLIAKTDTVKVYVKGNVEIRWKYKTKVINKDVYKDYWWKWPLILWALFTTLIVFIKFRTSILMFIKTLT